MLNNIFTHQRHWQRVSHFRHVFSTQRRFVCLRAWQCCISSSSLSVVFRGSSLAVSTRMSGGSQSESARYLVNKIIFLPDRTSLSNWNDGNSFSSWFEGVTTKHLTSAVVNRSWVWFVGVCRAMDTPPRLSSSGERHFSNRVSTFSVSQLVRNFCKIIYKKT